MLELGWTMAEVEIQIPLLFVLMGNTRGNMRTCQIIEFKKIPALWIIESKKITAHKAEEYENDEYVPSTALQGRSQLKAPGIL